MSKKQLQSDAARIKQLETAYGRRGVLIQELGLEIHTLKLALLTGKRKYYPTKGTQ